MPTYTTSILALLWFVSVVAQAQTSAGIGVGIGDCNDSPVCFWPSSVTIKAGEAVVFFWFADTVPTGPHNVVADDGSFRCAAGCDGEGGNGAPSVQWQFTRTFSKPGTVSFHDEVTGVRGQVVVVGTAFDIGPGITGAWYDPAQSGHGLLLEILSENRLYATWFAFDPAGTQQAWFTGVGTYSGDTATITDVVQPTGGRWIPNFDPAQVTRKPWGSLTFTFTDCNHGRVDFASVAGFGSGSMNLTRLTQPMGLSCP